jgi:O-antigen biosynthesis protein WbqP
VENNSISSIESKSTKKLYIYSFAKRCIDIICSLISIILLSPIFLIVAICIKYESRGPIIFKQLRAGQYSKPFYIYKFRSMTMDAPNKSTEEFLDSSTYITKVGRFIRKTSIDELPQIFNILKGDMSIVGPRPVILREKELIELRAKNGVDQILPGITGLAQINGRDKVSLLDKVKYDTEYLNNRSLLLDLKIVGITLLKVIMRTDTTI